MRCPDPSNKNVAATTTQPAQKQDKTWKKNTHDQMLLAEKKMERIEGNMKGWDMLGPLPGKSHVELNAILWDFHQGRDYSRGM